MNINEFAGYLANRGTDKASELYDDLCCEVCCCNVDKYLNIIANDDSYDDEEYSYSELLEWLGDDDNAYGHINCVISCDKYTDFSVLLETAKRDQDKDNYDEVYYELEKMLKEFDGDDELDDDDTPATYESILDAL